MRSVEGRRRHLLWAASKGGRTRITPLHHLTRERRPHKVEELGIEGHALLPCDLVRGSCIRRRPPPLLLARQQLLQRLVLLLVLLHSGPLCLELAFERRVLRLEARDHRCLVAQLLRGARAVGARAGVVRVPIVYRTGCSYGRCRRWRTRW
ncbi:hypothetical protein C8R46DRAFT_1097134 [Mycena filopes]|nr:hypothetical protein C8R46DRAFT_1097134 [Mycena filopes]